MTGPDQWTLLQARTAIREGAISTAEYASELTTRKRQRTDLHAFVDGGGPPPAALLPADSGPLGGIPLAVKDNIDVAGTSTTACTPALHQHLPLRDSAAWRRCSEAGAWLMGKTTMHELAYGVTGAHTDGLTARNPTDRDRLTGGSSSGTAAAVAAGLVPGGLGTDTGGSIRIPAALCGVAGFRPTTGRYPSQGLVRVSPTRDTVGVMARDVDDIKVLDAVLSGHVLPSAPPPSPAQRVLVLPRATTWTDLDPEVARVVEGACDALRAAGWSLRDFPEPLYDTAELLDVATSVPLAETRAAVEDYLRGHDSPHTFDTVIEGLASPDVRAILMPLLDGPAITPDLYHSALRTGARMASRALSALESAGAAAFLSPTTITAAPPLGTGWSMLRAGRPVPVFSTYIRNTAPSAVWGWPSLTLPAGYTSRGWPVGILLDAPPRHDRRLLDLGRLCARDLSMASLPGSPCTP